MTHDEVDKVLESVSATKEAIEFLLAERELINGKLERLGHTKTEAKAVTKRGRPKGSKNRKLLAALASEPLAADPPEVA